MDKCKLFYDEARRTVKASASQGTKITEETELVEKLGEISLEKIRALPELFIEEQKAWLANLIQAEQPKSWNLALGLMALWRNKVNNQVIAHLPDLVAELLLPKFLPESQGWDFMDIISIIDLTHSGLKKIQATEEMNVKEVKKALRILAVELLRAHLCILDALMPMLQIASNADSANNEMKNSASQAQVAAVGATGGVPSRNPGSVTMHMTYALKDVSVKDKGFHHLVQIYFGVEASQAFFSMANAGRWAEAEMVVGKELARISQRDSHYNLILALSNLKQHTDDRLSADVCYRVWSIIAPYLSTEEQAYILSRMGTKLGSPRENQALLEAFTQAPFPADVLCEAYDGQALAPDDIYKLFRCNPAQIQAKYAELMPSTKSQVSTGTKEAPSASSNASENAYKTKNRFSRHIPAREGRMMGHTPLNPQMDERSLPNLRRGQPSWTSMQAPMQGLHQQHQQYAPLNRGAHMHTAAPVNIMNHSHQRFPSQAPRPNEQYYDSYGQYGAAGNNLDGNKYDVYMYDRHNHLHYNIDNDYELNPDQSYIAATQNTSTGMIPGGMPLNDYIYKQDSNAYTLYDETPHNYVYSNPVMRDFPGTHLLSKQMMLNGHEVQATIDTGSACSIVDPTLAADPRYEVRPTNKNILLTSIGGPVEVPVVTIKMKKASGEDTEIRCAVADLSRSSRDRLLVGFPDLYRLGYYITINNMENIEMQKTIEVHSDEIMDPIADFDEGLVDEGNPDWEKHPFWKKFPNLLEYARKLQEITPDKYITFPGSAMPIHTDRIEISAYSNMRLVQGEIGAKIAREIDKWYERGWITPVTMSHDRIIYIPLLAVVKKNGDLRICLDFRRFNACVHPLECAIPKIHDFQAAFSGMTYFTEVDLSEAFMQLRLRDDNYYKLGIRTVNGYYTLNRAPFGLYTVPAHFQATIERMIAPVKGAKSYFDNVVIASKTLEEHAATLKQVMDIFLRYNVRVNLAKLQLCKTEMKMLGMIVSGEGIRADPEKIMKCLQMKKPGNATEMRRFIGATNFQRIFYPHASALMSQLNGMIDDKSKLIKWSPSTEQAYNRLRKAMTCEVALFFPKPEDHLVMYVDASDEGVAGALGVMDGDKFRVWKLHSKNISKVRHWSPTTKELFALVSSLNEFYPHIFGRHVTVYTDHKPLVNELRIKEPNKQLARWFEAISGLKFRVEYVPGRNNVLADYLSRVEWECDKEAQEAAMVAANSISGQTFTSWKEWQREQRLVLASERDPVPVNRISTHTRPSTQAPVERATHSQQISQMGEERGASSQQAWQQPALEIDFKKRLTLNNAQVLKDKAMMRAFNAQNDGTNNTIDITVTDSPLVLSQEQEKALFDRNVLWSYRDTAGNTRIFPHGEGIEEGYVLSPESEWAWISLAHADTGHGGNNSITSKLRQWNIDFPHKIAKIQSYLDSCTFCMRAKAVKHQHLPQRNQLAHQPFAKIAIDTAQLPYEDADGVTGMLAIVDVFTRFTWALPLKNLEDTTVARALVEWIWDHAAPVEIQSDQGTHFVNDVMKKVVDTMRVTYNVSVPYYPQSNGVVERAIGTIKTKLNVMVAQSDGRLPWSTYLKAATHAMNTVAKVYHGQVPFDMLYAIQAVPPVVASSVTLEENNIEEAVLLRHEQLLQMVSFERDQAMLRISKSTSKRNEAANKNRIMKPLLVGDMVLAKVLGKDNVTNIRWFGPYEIHEIDNMNNYILKAPNGSLCLRRFPRSHLKKADMRVREKKMVAEKIVDARVAGGMLEYKIGFQGYNKDSDVWVSARVVAEKFPALLARFEKAKEKLMMEVSLEEGQKLTELLDEEELAILDNAVSAPRMGLTLTAGEDEDGVAAAGQDAPLDSRFGGGEEREDSDAEPTHTSHIQSSNAESQVTTGTRLPSHTPVPVQPTHTSQTTSVANRTPLQPVSVDEDAELLELMTTFRDIERRRNAPPQPTPRSAPLPRNPAAEARHRHFAQQHYGPRGYNRAYGRAPYGRRIDDEG